MRTVEERDFSSMNMVLSRADVTPAKEAVLLRRMSLSELSKLIDLLEEAALPSSTRNPKNEKLEDRIRAIMKRYFRNLGLALPLDEIEAIYYKYIEQE